VSHQVTHAALATKHGKESIFSPAFAEIGIVVAVAGIDTDQFGTFAGEIERQGSPRETAERKARSGAEALGLTIGLASEGSFGPHPATPFLLADTEVVVYVDTKLDYSVFEVARSISAVPPAIVINDSDDIDSLKITNLFPEQGAIVVAEDPETKSRYVLAKGIDNVDELRSTVAQALADQSHPIIVEPDLRAHHCPDRRKVLGIAVDRLVQRLRVSCPKCHAAGFGPLRTISGLRCRLCGLPTTSTAFDVMGCSRCGFENEVARTGEADPTFCDRCNP
jgi:Zn finger protein HypA/HybF involved in hydrogenase expression